MIAKQDGVVLLDLELDPGRSYTLGRSPSNDIQLEAPSISRLHAVIFWHENAWFIADLDSSRGLRDDSGDISFSQFTDGEWVALGPAFIWYRDERTQSTESESVNTEKQDTFDRHRTILLIESSDDSEPRIQGTYALDERRTVTAGSSNRCDIVLKNDEISDLEFVFFRRRNHWHCVHTASNQTACSDPHQKCHTQLEDNTRMKVGKLSLTLLKAPILPKIAHSAALRGGQITSEEDFSIDTIDLAAAAKAGRGRGPEQPNSG